MVYLAKQTSSEVGVAMKSTSLFALALLGLWCLMIIWRGSFANAGDPPPEKKIENDQPAQKQAATYKTLFEKVGRAGLPELLKDKDTGVALQAAWELHKKLVKRDKPNKDSTLIRSTETYDATEMKKFLAFIKDRTKAPIPDWWAAGISDLYVVDMDEVRGHLYFGDIPRLKEIELGDQTWLVREGVIMKRQGKITSYQSGDVTLQVPKELFPKLDRANLADLVTEKETCLASYQSSGGYRFNVAKVDNKTSKHVWTAEVWAVDRRTLFGPSAMHRIEMTQAGDVLFVFGAEAFGMYIEAFDLETGKSQFRFCSSNWRNYSEKWKLK